MRMIKVWKAVVTTPKGRKFTYSPFFDRLGAEEVIKEYTDLGWTGEVVEFKIAAPTNRPQYR